MHEAVAAFCWPSEKVATASRDFSVLSKSLKMHEAVIMFFEVAAGGLGGQTPPPPPGATARRHRPGKSHRRSGQIIQAQWANQTGTVGKSYRHKAGKSYKYGVQITQARIKRAQ